MTEKLAQYIQTKQIWDIPGGIHPPENKEQSLRNPIIEAPLPDRIILPLAMHIGAPAEALVQTGDKVKTGQMVAAPKGLVSASIHSSISGTVTAIEDHPLAHPSGMNGPCVVIESDGLDTWTELTPVKNYREVEPEKLVGILRNAGLAGMGGAGFPTAVKLQPRHSIDTLILNGSECEPYITADHALMRERAGDVIQGALLLAYIVGEPEEILIGVEDNKPDAIQALHQAIEASGDSRLQLRVFPTKYPSGGEKQLIQILTGKEVKSGGLPADLGILVQNVGSAVAAWDAVAQGKPLITRVTTLVGEALGVQNNYLVRIGTPVADLLELAQVNKDKSDRIVVGGPMMGFTLLDDEVPVTKITNCLLVPSKEELSPPPPAQACIRCGLCAEACPVNLLPQQLFWYAQVEDHDKLRDYSLFDCIECGACAYVCPSNIPLVQYYRAAKGDIRETERETIKSDHARLRFEARKERLEKEAVEREAKRKARMEAAKAKQANSEGTDDLVAAAMERVKKANTNPEEARQKLERQKSTFAERIEGIREKIASAESDEIKDKFSAQLKNAQKKLAGIEEKLNALADEPKTAEANALTQKDAATAAIERARKKSEAMANMDESEKLKSSLDSLKARRDKAAAKLAEAESAGADTVDALRTGLDKLEQKIEATEKQIADLGDN
ncbi:MAG: electron transport complex subunit RsxC [Porticoccaceae bacterium]